MRIITIAISVILISSISLFGQTIFDIEIDEVYLDHNDVYFINKGEINSYLCELNSVIIKDFEHKMILLCEEDNDWMYSDNPIPIRFEQIIPFDQPNELMEHIKYHKFDKSTNQTNQKDKAFLQYFSDDLFANLYYKNYGSENPDWKFYRAEFWDFIFIRINGKYLIVGLVYENDPSIGGYIIPTKDETLVMVKNFSYKKNGERIDSVDIKKHMSLKNFYRIKNTTDGKQIMDKLFQEKILNKHFDEIHIKENFIHCYSENKMELYSKSGEKINIKYLSAAYDSLGSIQCIIKDEIKWLDYEWNIHDTFPIPRQALCGTISSTSRKIEKIDNQYFESYVTGYWGQKENRDSVLIRKDIDVKGITYLNNEHSNEFNEYSNLWAVFSYPYSYYIVTLENEKQLMSITNKKNARKEKLIIERDYLIQSEIEIDSLNTLISGLQNEIEIEVLFEGNFESFGYNHPIRFESNGLFGYYPQNQFAKYKRLEKFNFFFAEFEDKDERVGWLDIFGNEFYKEN